MRSVYKYRSYFRAVLFSVAVAFVIDAALHLDELGHGLHQSREKVQEIVHADSLLNTTKKAVFSPGALIKTFFTGR